MSERYDTRTDSRTQVTLKFRTSQPSEYVVRDVQNSGIYADHTAIESVTIRETRVTRMVPEWLRIRQAAARAGRETRQLVMDSPDPRD